MSLPSLVKQIRNCDVCKSKLPLGPRPVFQISTNAKILVAGQAPGIRVHRSGVPFDDPSGDRLRLWMGVDKETFYDEQTLAILPMAFCYPGTGKSGDLPPTPECAEKWRQDLLSKLPNLKLTLLIGQYAIQYHLGKNKKNNLTETVRNWKSYGPGILPLPHPSPRNNIWLKKNPWFERDVLPNLKLQVNSLLI